MYHLKEKPWVHNQRFGPWGPNKVWPCRVRVRVAVRVAVRVTVRVIGGEDLSPYPCMQGRVLRHALK